MFEDLTAKLEAFSTTKRAAIIKRWRRIVTPELRALGRQIDPFKGKAKPKPKSVFGAEPDRRDKQAVSIWGVHPNIAADPRYNTPPEGFRSVKPFPVETPRGWITVKRAQAHWRKRHFVHPYWNRTNFQWHFTIGGMVYGIATGIESDGKHYAGHVIPIYSARSVPDMIMDYPGLEEIIRKTFEQAVMEELA